MAADSLPRRWDDLSRPGPSSSPAPPSRRSCRDRPRKQKFSRHHVDFPMEGQGLRQEFASSARSRPPLGREAAARLRGRRSLARAAAATRQGRRSPGRVFQPRSRPRRTVGSYDPAPPERERRHNHRANRVAVSETSASYLWEAVASAHAHASRAQSCAILAILPERHPSSRRALSQACPTPWQRD